jgi:2-oxoisovalerate dehydrogenase E1 component beta subunit
MAETTYLEAIRQALFEEMDRDPAVVLIGEDVGVYGGAFKVSEGLLEKFGWERVIETPISESAIVGAAVGMGYAGLRPVAEMQFIDFIACCFNQITNFAAKSHYRWGAPVPLVLRGPCGGGVHGGPFHSANPEMYFVHTPGLKVVCPATPYDAKGLLKSAIRDNNPVLFFEHKFLYRRIKENLPEGEFTVPIGKAVVRREGRDLTIVSYAAMLHASLEAAHAAAARPRYDSRVGPQDQQAAGGARRHAHRRDRRRNRGRGHGERLRGSRRADTPRDFARYSGAVRAAAGGIFHAQCREGCCRGAGTGTVLVTS